jgi:hypothetical protein
VLLYADIMELKNKNTIRCLATGRKMILLGTGYSLVTALSPKPALDTLDSPAEALAPEPRS